MRLLFLLYPVIIDEVKGNIKSVAIQYRKAEARRVRNET